MELFDCTTRLWENPLVPQVNRLKSRPPLFTWKTAEEARRGTPEPFECPAVQSLNGQWDFWLFDRPEEVDLSLLAAAAPVKGARPIQVPGNWTRQGFDRPYYINVCMPFGDAPPKVPREHNPCGVYRRNLLVREGFERVVLHFGGIESCGFIYVNGTCAGMVKDSRTSSEFDVTDFVHAGDNCLAVLVIRWSDGSFLEDQDHWRMAGIFRDVYLQYTPKAHIADVSVQTTLDEATESVGILKVRLEAEFQGEQEIPSGWKFQLQLFDCEDGRALWAAPRELPFTEIDTMFLYPGTRLPYAEFSCEFPRIRRWSAETPHLYRLVVCLVAQDGTVAEATGTDLGFRSVRRKDGFLLINGQPVKFFGVNRHDFNERLGKTVTCEDIAADLQMMKRLNLNAIRTCHYPNDERLAALANRLGLYVISEADIECHAYREHLSGDPRWLPAMQERVGRMVQIYRNNPCIHLWSLGNEAGRGANFHALAAWLHALDPSRGVHYGDLACQPDERLGTYTPHDGEALVDVVAPMYPTFAAIDNWLEHCMPVESRPFIPCEYSHAMGNSNGGLARYFEYFRKHPRCQGGYLWDWMDQGLAEIDENGRKYWTYGGDHGEPVHDANFCINGLLLPDRTPHPVCHEVKFLARPFDFVSKKLSEGRFTLKNWHYFIPLDHLSFAWELQLDGRAVQSGELSPEVFRGLLPQHEREVLLAYDLGQLVHHPGQELFLTITARESAATAWAPAGRLVAQQQFDLTECLPQVNSPLCPQIIGTAPPRSLQFTTGGMPRQWRFNGKELLAGAIQEQFARGCVDNDGIKAFIATGHHHVACKWINQWDIFHPECRERLVADELLADGTRFLNATVTYGMKSGDRLEVQRRIWVADGWLLLQLDFHVPEALDDLPRLGVTIPLPHGFEKLHFFGRGPHENYWDRRAGTRVGLYHQTVAGQYFPYVMPQETGNHTDVRMIAVDNGEVGLMAVGAGMLLEASALHFTPQDLFDAHHINELAPRRETFLNLDIHQRGLGTATCGEDTTPSCRIHAGNHRLALRLVPYDARTTDLMVLARHFADWTSREGQSGPQS